MLNVDGATPVVRSTCPTYSETDAVQLQFRGPSYAEASIGCDSVDSDSP